MMLNKYFGQKLKESRLKQNPPVTQEKLARDLGISRSTLLNYEKAKSSPPWWFVCIVSRYFDKQLEHYNYLKEKEDDRFESFTS